MAFRWCADDGPTLNAGLVAFRISSRGSGPVLLRNSYFCDFSGWWSGPPVPPSWDRPILRPHLIVRIGFCTTLCTFYCMHNFLIGETFFPEFHSGVIWIQRERGGWCMHILTGKSKCIGGSTRRERERCVCVLFEFCHFFNTEHSSKYFKVSSTDLCKINLIVRDTCSP